MWPICRKKKNAGMEIAFKRAQWLNFADKDFKVAVIYAKNWRELCLKSKSKYYDNVSSNTECQKWDANHERKLNRNFGVEK